MKREPYFFRRKNSAGTQENLFDFLRDFDPINEKYFFDAYERTSTPERRSIANQYEDAFQFGSMSKYGYSSIQDNLKLVYGDPGVIDDDIKAYHLTEKKIIHSFLGIPQLDKMFDEDYFNFEWDMHVGQNFNEHRNNYYRDHFIHQIRDMYMMLVMLKEYDLGLATKQILQDRKVSRISEYVCKLYNSFMSDQHLPQRQTLEKICAANINGKLDVDQYATDYYFNYVIKASSILAALFHDMGYPICHFLEVRHRLSNYNPTLYMITHNATDSFDQIASLLRPSLLFMLVPLQDIKERLEIHKGKYDHGAYSAVAFLLQFYNNGVIWSLSPEKRCAIEIAALAIFNHTAKYSVVDNKFHPYYSLFYRQNPIAFLLRVCDDLQEWDRRYFEISDASDLMFCPKCFSPLIKINTPLQKSSTSETDVEYSCYVCRCRKTPNDGAIIRPDIFMKRKLYLVTVSDDVEVKYNNKEWTLDITINYDLYKLLMLSNINNTYAKFRHKELVGLQHLLLNQIYQYDGGDVPLYSKIRLFYFMSPNPLLIKLKILDEYLRKRYKELHAPDHHGSDINAIDISVIIGRLDGDTLDDKCLAIVDALCQGNDDAVETQDTKQLFSIILSFYVKLLQECLNNKSKGAACFCDDFFGNIKEADSLYLETMKVLIEDCFAQYENANYNSLLLTCTGDDYIKRAVSDKLYYHIGAYTNTQNVFNDLNSIKNNEKDENGKVVYPYIGYYFDIWLFRAMIYYEEGENSSDDDDTTQPTSPES